MSATTDLELWTAPGIPLGSLLMALSQFTARTGLVPVSLRITPGAVAPGAALELWLDDAPFATLLTSWAVDGLRMVEDPGGRWVQYGGVRVWRGHPVSATGGG